MVGEFGDLKRAFRAFRARGQGEAEGEDNDAALCCGGGEDGVVGEEFQIVYSEGVEKALDVISVVAIRTKYKDMI